MSEYKYMEPTRILQILNYVFKDEIAEMDEERDAAREAYKEDARALGKLGLTARTLNCLLRAGMTLKTANAASDKRLRKIRNFGAKGLAEFRHKASLTREQTVAEKVYMRHGGGK